MGERKEGSHVKGAKSRMGVGFVKFDWVRRGRTWGGVGRPPRGPQGTPSTYFLGRSVAGRRRRRRRRRRHRRRRRRRRRRRHARGGDSNPSQPRGDYRGM